MNVKKAKRLFLFLGIFILATSMFVIAKPEFISVKNPTARSFEIPKNAVQISEDVFNLGTARDADGKLVQGFMFIHGKKEFAKPSRIISGGRETCYAFLSNGARWKKTEPYIVDTSNNAGLNSDFIKSNLALDIDEWEIAGETNIIENEVQGVVDRANIGNLNGKNEIIFANVESKGAIAVTIVWGIFSGPIKNRELVEWDQVYDDSDFPWSSTGESGKMDFENIAQHELGHSAGLAHPPNTCTEETMYAYADFGETKKRDLNKGDIAGISKLY